MTPDLLNLQKTIMDGHHKYIYNNLQLTTIANVSSVTKL
jgi:hypothetical protein